MQLSVIILNYNVRYFLEHCLKSVQRALQNIDAEIIVVDNNSPDDSCQMVKNLFPEVILIENKENLGFPKGNNIGVQQANGMYICILNPDTVVAEDTFEKLLEFAQQKSDLGIIGCKLIDGTGNFLPESKRGIPTPWVAFSKTFGLYKLFPSIKRFQKYYAQHLDENTTGQVDILVGAFMFLRKETYMQLGGFDESYFMYGEDIDLSYAALKLNLKNYYYASTTVIHYKGESTVKDEKYRRRFQEGMELFYAKHMNGNFVGNILMKIGMKLFAIFKMKSKTGNTASKKIQYKLLSHDIVLKELLASKLNKEIELINNDFSAVKSSDTVSTEIILDTNACSYKECIKFMEQNKNKGLTFKIKPPESDFFIGSNSSNDRGEVILF